MSELAAIIEHQKAMNRVTWDAMQEAGLGEGAEVSLDFFYEAPDQERANQLVALIQSATDYDVTASAVDRGVFRKKGWAVNGSTKPTAVSLPVLDDWVEWMAKAGHERNCVFDGWGAMAPS